MFKINQADQKQEKQLASSTLPTLWSRNEAEHNHNI